MTYKDKFEASEQRAHYQNIATKILREMTVLRSLVESSSIAPRRWVWELIQNAKDVHLNEGVKIKIEHHPDIDNPYISFKHNGMPFTADNIRFLIEQISTKDRKKDNLGKQKTTGKFGTGFLATHLLSETVTVKGIAKEPELDYREFQLVLDRSGFELEQITDAVQKAKILIEDLDSAPVFTKYVEGEFHTEFLYPLADSVSFRVAKSGLDDLDNCLPYTLAFVREIKSVEISTSEKFYKNTDRDFYLNDNFRLVNILIDDKNEKEKESILFTIALLNKGLTSIAIPILKKEDTITLIPIREQTPRLFCDFPLIGAEKFHFPVIINNPNFNPTDSRDGVFLTTSARMNPLTEENKKIINDAVELYFQLLDFAVKNKWCDLHILAQIKPLSDLPDWVDNNWFNKEVLSPIRKKLLYTNIVNNSLGDLAPILNPVGKQYIWFPNSTIKEVRGKIWQLANYWFPHCLPKQLDVELWYKLSWEECGRLNIDQFAVFVESMGNVEKLSEVLKNKEVFDWLNDFYLLLKLEEKEYDIIINKRSIFPNQNGIFCKKAHLKKDVGNIEIDFKDILKMLGNDIRNELIDERINVEFESEYFRDQSYAVKEINALVNELVIDREAAKSYSSAFRKLLRWFQEQPVKAKSLFSALYKNKHLLYDDDEILENIAKAEQMDDLLKEYQAKNINELRELIVKGQSHDNSLLPITQNILVSMGISSIDEWAEAIKDKNLAELFSHESTPTTDMFVYVQSLIKQAKQKIIEYLSTLSDYDLSGLDENTAPTVLAGIQKDGREISIVIRPAYNAEVIIYYGSERDILDYEPSELWIDDGKLPRQITLGHILKKAKIIKFPV
jgi:hypothetical protein